MANDRLRIRLGGGYTPHEFLDAMDRIVQTLVANGVGEIRGANLYLQPFQGSRQLFFHDQETGAPFQILQYDGPHERPYKPITTRLRPIVSDD